MRCGRAASRRGLKPTGWALAWALRMVVLDATPAQAQGQGASEAEPAGEGEAIVLDVAHDAEEAAVAERASELDGLFLATLQDLGWSIDLSAAPSSVDDHALERLAEETSALVVRPSLERVGDRYELRIVAAHPDEDVLRMRVSRVEPSDLQVRAVVMLRDVATTPAPEAQTPRAEPRAELSEPTRSEGRALLATNGTIAGGFVGYSIQRSSGSDDPRLLYPLMAVGAGVGLGAAIIISDEWDVGVGEALYLTAGTWWPAAAGHLIHAGRFGATSRVDNEQWTFGLIGSVAGLSLSTALVADRGMGLGGAVLAHSGGAMGTVVGGLIDMGGSGIHDAFPIAGMGYGAGGGWLLASAAATLFEPEPTDVLLVDLGVLLGGLAGASAASPLLFEDPSPDKTRGWVGASGAGLVVGGTVAYLLLPDDEAERADTPAWWQAVPVAARVGGSWGPGELGASGYGLRWHGTW